MKVLMWLFLLFGIVLAATLYFKEEVEPEYSFTDIWTKDNRLIAHALGGINGHRYTNSLEAFQYNYDKGYRVFEVDFTLTSDEKLVARHGWSDKTNKHIKQDLIIYDGESANYDDFMQTPLYGLYTPIDIYDVMALMEKYEDVFLIIDITKSSRDLVDKKYKLIIEAANHNPQVLDRIIPQIYHEWMLDDLMALYDFKSMIYTVYKIPNEEYSEEAVIQFLEKSGINLLVVHKKRANQDFLKELNRNRVKTYIHTVNNLYYVEQDLLEREQVRPYGYMTDFIDLGKFNELLP